MLKTASFYAERHSIVWNSYFKRLTRSEMHETTPSKKINFGIVDRMKPCCSGTGTKD